MKLPEKFESNIERIPETGCWIWMGSLNRNGYGRYILGGRTRVVHRLIWILLGKPLSDKEVLDHLCRVRCCCNPHHLEPVTHRENTLRGEAVLFK